MEDFVSFEQAQSLKKLGFNWPVDSYYVKFKDGNIVMAFITEDYRVNKNVNGWGINNKYSSPTLAQAQKWLRMTQGIFVQSAFIKACDGSIVFESGMCVGSMIYIIPQASKKYEEALKKAIDTALKYLKEEGK